MADEKLVCGVHIISLRNHIIETYDEASQARIWEHFSPEAREMLDQVSRTNWYPYRLVAEMNRGIYLAGGDDEAGYTATVSAGAAAAKDATQTFLRLLIKLMTPEIMARKWPTVWKRSHNFGTMDTKLDPAVERRLLMRLGDVEGYDYIAPVAVGFLTYSLQAMGLPQASVLQRGDRSVPAASAVEFEVTW